MSHNCTASIEQTGSVAKLQSSVWEFIFVSCVVRLCGLPPHSKLKTEAVPSFETLFSYKSARRNTLENNHLHQVSATCGPRASCGPETRLFVNEENISITTYKLSQCTGKRIKTIMKQKICTYRPITLKSRYCTNVYIVLLSKPYEM